MALFTLEKMADGGMYDHLGGGFHRYSVDARWHVPHFEKMLYDQAQLAWNYLAAFQISGRTRFREIAGGILDYVLRDLTSPTGGFSSAEDADSLPAYSGSTELADLSDEASAKSEVLSVGGSIADAPEKREGAFYVWTPGQLREVLGEEDAAFAAEVFGVTKRGTFEDGASVLQRRADPVSRHRCV